MTATESFDRTMSDADSLLWTIGRDPVLRPTIVVVATLDGPPGWEVVRARFEELTKQFPQLRARVLSRPLGIWRPKWVADRSFDLDLHLRRQRAAPPARLRGVLDLAQAMASSGFDPELPPWEAVVVEGLTGHKAALVVKLHHALVDGVGGIAVLLHLLDPERHPAAPSGPHAGPPGEEQAPVHEHTWRAQDLLRQARAGGHALPRVVVPSIGQVLATASSVAKLLAPARRPLSPVTAGRSSGRWFDVIDLPDGALRRAARATGSTLNDVFLAGILMGLRRYHELHARPVDRLRVLMPVSVRKPAHALAGNHFVPARFVLPLQADAQRCVREVHEIAGGYRNDPALAFSDLLAACLDLLPAPLATAVWGSMLKGDDFCATDVPGPTSETYLAGARIEGLYAFAPPSGAALNVSLLTPAGRDCIGVNIDAAAVSDGSKMVASLEEGFADVLRLAEEATAEERT